VSGTGLDPVSNQVVVFVDRLDSPLQSTLTDKFGDAIKFEG